MKAAIFYNNSNTEAKLVAQKTADVLKNSGIFTLTLPENSVVLKQCEYIADNKIYKEADFCVIIGGDGTIIKFAKNAALNFKPVIGINVGRLGYLADIEPDNLECLSRLASGEYSVEERFMLKAEIKYRNGNSEIHYCVNDAVLSRGSESNMLDIFIDVYGERFNYRADGLIFATPTGSTAYSLSAGGPVVSPEIDGIIMSPICSHSLNSRPVIFSTDTVINSGVLDHYGCNAAVSFDWEKRIELKEGMILSISSGEFPLKLIRINGASFYKRLFAKFK